LSALLVTVQAWHDGDSSPSQGVASEQPRSTEARLLPTAHLAVPPTLEAMWYVPQATTPAKGAVADLARGAELLEGSGDTADASEALRLVSNVALEKLPIADYARYYRGVALQRLNRPEEADAAYASVSSKAEAQLPHSALYRRAEIREAKNDFAGAVVFYEQIMARKPASMQIALVKLAAAASAAGDRARAIAAHRRVLREFTITPEAAEAERLLDQLGGFELDTAEAVAEEFGRADALFRARKYDQAQQAFTRVSGRLEGEDRDRATLRLAQIQAAKGQHRQARDTFRRFAAHPTLAPEALFGILSAARALGAHGEANGLTDDFVARYPQHRLAEEALNEMARRYVLDDDDGEAAEIYTRMIDRFPAGAFAERGTWKAGWWAYRERNFAETVRVFERGAASFPRSDYRPSWLYWSGRAHEQLGDRGKAVERYRLTATDYRNTYYGRLAWTRLEGLNEASDVTAGRAPAVHAPVAPANAGLIKALIAAGLYHAALNELQYAQKVEGDSAPLQATIALVHNRMGHLRLGITAMRRAYPQFMAAGGENLPPEILRVIFPIDFWPLIKGNAQVHGLDPFMLTALAAQESTFDPEIRSSANAVGLMQIIPPTGRRLAKQIGVRNFSERSLQNPEINARLGTHYFASMYKEFGGYHFALAGYNAGEHRVRRWNEEAPGLPPDEWIDNIPFPETQNYVKRILGTAEDYRRLYGDESITSTVNRKPPAATKTSPAAKKAPTKKAPAKKAPVKKGR
jgi:soluble lytic murein transglycosylase